MIRRTMFAVGLAALAGAVLAQEPVGPSEEGMPLDLYRRLDALTQVIEGAKVRPAGTENMTQDQARDAMVETVNTNIAALQKALNFRQVIQRRLAAKALGYCSDKPEALKTLIPAVKDGDADVRLAAVSSLKQMPDGMAAESLMGAVDDPDERVRGVAALALGAIRDSRASKPLMRLLQDKAWVNRMYAAQALGEVKDRSIADELQKLFESEKDPRVRMALAVALRKILDAETETTEGTMAPEQEQNILHELAGEMNRVEGKLRDDIHDATVQVPQKDIDDKLAQLIAKIEEMMAQGQGQGQGQQQDQQSGQSQGQSSGNPSSPLRTSVLPSGNPRGALQPGEVVGHEAAWAHLPPAARDELNQVYKEELPERWRRRLEQYFLSVAAEENKGK